MKVRIYTSNPNTQLKELGAIILQHGRLVPHPNNLALASLLSEPLVIYENEKRVRIDPVRQPREFLATLPAQAEGHQPAERL